MPSFSDSWRNVYILLYEHREKWRNLISGQAAREKAEVYMERRSGEDCVWLEQIRQLIIILVAVSIKLSLYIYGTISRPELIALRIQYFACFACNQLQSRNWTEPS